VNNSTSRINYMFIKSDKYELWCSEKRDCWTWG